MLYERAHEKCNIAMEALAAPNATTQECVAKAFLHGLFYIHDSDIDPELKRRLDYIRKQLTRFNDRGGDGAVNVTASEIDEHDAFHIAQLIAIFCGKVARKFDTQWRRYEQQQARRKKQ